MRSAGPVRESAGLVAIAALVFGGIMSAQVEGTGPKPTIPGRQSMAGSLSPAQPNRTFAVKLRPGVYRLTYISSASPAVLQVTVDGVVVGLASPTQPFATVMRIVNDRLQGTTDLPPTGLCSSDVSTEGSCAGQKFHFRLTHESDVSINTPTGDAPSSKKAEIIARLRRAKGVSLPEIQKLTGWQKHTVRGFISVLGSKTGLKIISTRNDAGERTYRVAK